MIHEQIKKKNRFTNGLRKVTHTDEFSILIPLVAIIFVTFLFRPDFLSVNNFASMFNQIPFIAIVALAVSFPLMTGNVDISTGRVAGFAGIVMSALIVDSSWHWFPAMMLALGVGALIGLLNGLLVVKLSIPDFVATMGTLYVFGGARYLFIKGYQLSLNTLAPGHPGYGVTQFFDERFLGMPFYFWIMVAIFVVAFIAVKRTMWGRRLLAVGDNREVAALSGIKVTKMRFNAFMLCGLLSAAAGILLTLDIGMGLPETGDGWEFRAIAGCAVGGVSLAGGKGSPLGVLIGITLIFVAENAIIFLGFPTTMRIAVQGALIAAAVLFDVLRQKKKIKE